MDTLPTFAQQAFQGFVDDAAPATASAISAAVNTNFTRRASALWQLRFRIAQTTLNITTGNTITITVRHQVNGAGGFIATGAQGASGTKVRFAASANFTDDTAITTGNFRLGSGTGTAITGIADENGSIVFGFNTGNGTQEYSEVLFNLEWGTTIADGDLIEFRVYQTNGTAFGTYTVTPTVRYNGTGAPIEVVNTAIVAGGGDYTLLASWESGEQRDLVAVDEIDVLECQAGSTSESFFVGGSTTDATHYREIRAAAGHEHGGDPTAGFKAASSSATAASIRHFDDHLHIKGIVLSSGAQTSGVVANPVSNFDYHLIGCIVIAENSAVGYAGAPTGATYIYRNNIYYGSANNFPITVSANHYVYNNTVIVTGLRGIFGTAAELYNNIVQGATSACFGGGTLNGGNISSDATSPQTGLRNITLTFADAASNDYHLDATDTSAIDAGTDLSAATHPFSDDIDGDSRPQGSAWDIGADEIEAAAAPSGTAACSLQAFGAAASGELVYVASGAAGVQPLTASAQGAFEASGAAAAALQHLAADAEGQHVAFLGAAAGDLQPLEAAALGELIFLATAVAALQPIAGAAQGAFEMTGTAATALQHLAAAVSGSFAADDTVAGAAAGALQPLAASATGLESFDGSAAGALQHLASAAAGELVPEGTAAAALQHLSAAASGAESFNGEAVAALQHLLADALAAMEASGSAAAALQHLRAIASGQHGDVVPVRGARVSLLQRLSMNRLSWRN